MRELSLNLLDIAENSVKAKATLIEITVTVKANLLTFVIKDNGCGMDEAFLAKVTDPFTTTRTTRKVGMGIPLLKMIAEMSGGEFAITSEKGVGTTTSATFQLDHINRPPLGDLADSIVALVTDLGDSNLIFTYSVENEKFVFDTREVRAELEDIPMDNPEILVFIRDLIKQNVEITNGGLNI
ncbi:MAG: sensor histidine kinase [Clostridia bacterium]|nr:sensor histidine kinase [Clostridia bacterium]